MTVAGRMLAGTPYSVQAPQPHSASIAQARGKWSAASENTLTAPGVFNFGYEFHFWYLKL